MASDHSARRCHKVVHRPNEAYLHAADDDEPYSVDGVQYCGRCHYCIISGTMENRDAAWPVVVDDLYEDEEEVTPEARAEKAERERDEAATAIRAYLTRWEEIEPAVKGQALNAMAHGLTYTEEEISAAPQFEALRAWLERYDAKEVEGA